MNATAKEYMLPMTTAPGKSILPSHVVKLSPLADFSVETAGPNDVPFGISQNWTAGAPGTPFNDGFVSTVAKPSLMVWGPGAIAVAGQKDSTAVLTPGTSVGADADGEMVAVTNGWAVGWVLEGSSALKTQRLRVFVFPHHKGGGSD